MNKINLFLKLTWLFLFALLLVGCEDGLLSGTLIFEGMHQFDSETVLLGDVLVQAGTAEFATGSRVAGSVYVVGGGLVLDGTVDGDLILLDGQVTLGPKAVVGGDLRMGGRGCSRATCTT